MIINLDPDMETVFPDKNQRFNHIMQLRGTVYRELEGRRTQQVLLNNKSYFIKQHFGVGWKEIFKNLFQLRLPVISAKNEWQAIARLHELQIPTLEVVGYGMRGVNPAQRQSFLISRELPLFITLEDLGKKWQTDAPSFAFKLALIREVARIAKTIHSDGMNHRDFYLCHFLLDLIEYETDGCVKLYLIDLHRAMMHKKTPQRWVIKDLAGLYFSSQDIGLTQRDWLRFIKLYRGQPLRDVINKETVFWQKVKTRGDKLYRSHGKK